jgi:hypothetical protein
MTEQLMLSTHFSFIESYRSQIATRLEIDNVPPASIRPRLMAQAALLERIRARLSFARGRDIPLNSSSWYRCLALNRALKSSDTSHHILGGATDFEAPTFGSPTAIARFLEPLVDELGIGQLINEYPDKDGWVHVSSIAVPLAVNRIITITHKGTTPGIQGA